MAQQKELRGGIGCFCKGNSGGRPKGRFYTALVRQADGSGAGTIFQCTGRSAGLVSRNPPNAPKHVVAEAPACRILLSDPSQRYDAPPDAPLSSPWQGQTAWPAFAG